MAHTRALHLEQWADDNQARQFLPLLVRKLIYKTSPALTKLNVPASEQVQRPGFDGIVHTAKGNRYVPDGNSVWEMGTNKDVKTKANDDFEKRTAATSPDQRQNSVFIFVTTRTWLKKDDWAQEKKANSDWLHVVAYDANDLEHWLELALDVDIWFSQLTNRTPPDVHILSEYWKSLSSIAANPLTPQVFLASREDAIQSVERWLTDPPDSIFIQTHGLRDGIDFVAALSGDGNHDVLEDSLIVESREAWRQLAANGERLILIGSPTLEIGAADTASAVQRGHHVLLSGPHALVAENKVVALGRQDHYAINEALIASGYHDARAMKYARACGGSSSILKRLITKHPDTEFPEWYRNREHRIKLAPFSLVGGWLDVDPEPEPADLGFPRIGAGPQKDLLVVPELVGLSRTEVQKCVNMWQHGLEPLFLRIGDRVLVLSREDAWYLLGGSVSRDRLKRFSELAKLILSEDDPAFELSVDERWLANIKGKVFSLSNDLRRSIVESMVLMSCYRCADLPSNNVNFQEIVRGIFSEVLPATATWQRWASLGFNLVLLAEADPDYLLQRIEDDLDSESASIPELFANQSNSLFGRSIHCDILWALECLAWSQHYLDRVAIVLAKLTPLVPSDGNANRPENSFHEIFLLWLPHTSATVEQRLAALARISREVPDVGWQLLKDLMPSGLNSLSHGTHLPRWRSWADGWSRGKVQSEMPEYGLGVAQLLLDVAGSDSSRWADVLDGMLRFNPEITEKVLTSLGKIAVNVAIDESKKHPLWRKVRDLVQDHQIYSDAEWAFAPELVAELAKLQEALEPTDPVLKFEWLFDRQAELLSPAPEDGVELHDETLEQERANALQEIIANQGVAGVEKLIELSNFPGGIGWLIGKEQLLKWNEIGLPKALANSNAKLLDCTANYITGAFFRHQWDFVNELPTSEWEAQNIATLALALPFSRDTWAWLERFSDEAKQSYWTRASGFLRNPSLEDVRFATAQLIQNKRPFTAIDLVYFCIHQKLEVPNELIATILSATLQTKSTEDLTSMHNVSYDIQRLIKMLQDDPKFDRTHLAQIEWGFLNILDRTHSYTGPNTLVTELAASPQLFVEMLRLIYRGKNESLEVEVSEQDRLKAGHASELLDGLDQLPGRTEDGDLVVATLSGWIVNARQLARETGHLAVCDIAIGRIIARDWKRFTAETGPSHEVAKLMENPEIASDELFRGFIVGAINSDGVSFRSPTEGGKQERQRAERCRKLSDELRSTSSRLATAFDDLASRYEARGVSEDNDAEGIRLGRY